MLFCVFGLNATVQKTLLFGITYESITNEQTNSKARRERKRWEKWRNIKKKREKQLQTKCDFLNMQRELLVNENPIYSDQSIHPCYTYSTIWQVVVSHFYESKFTVARVCFEQYRPYYSQPPYRFGFVDIWSHVVWKLQKKLSNWAIEKQKMQQTFRNIRKSNRATDR